MTNSAYLRPLTPNFLLQVRVHGAPIRFKLRI